ncbi:5-hydroxymethyluracil DNA glycosylase, putative [Babesia ovis]|uniref:5-hydroxymethyluracil DNA glycosylase, putative n=1 Tax=Babesia ovis TaxID=5869 RepID=A0A9W5T9W5_BABOV|nr:5-hydroxymethyluracil DNA glycosylase, putative [Babesia ovis]
MESAERFNILSADFDSSALLDASENIPFDKVHDRFYTSLLGAINDKTLSASIEHLRDSRLSLGRISHSSFLLPWSTQPVTQFSDSTTTTAESVDYSPTSKCSQLKEHLHAFVSRSKDEAETVKRLLELRLTGYTLTRNNCYNFLQSAYKKDCEIVVCVQPSPCSKSVRYRGRIIFFDRGSNILLSNVKSEGLADLPFIYISSKSVLSISHG